MIRQAHGYKKDDSVKVTQQARFFQPENTHGLIRKKSQGQKVSDSVMKY